MAMPDRVRKRFDLLPEPLIADTAYGSGPMPSWLVDGNIAPKFPSSTTRISGTAADGFPGSW
ncbi:hypothetical protein RA27_22190 [Ruegeria sp. ANG-R]|nr:hypothetical protein RA27_22190 [Ruegeria sp. ANG-R]